MVYKRKEKIRYDPMPVGVDSGSSRTVEVHFSFADVIRPPSGVLPTSWIAGHIQTLNDLYSYPRDDQNGLDVVATENAPNVNLTHALHQFRKLRKQLRREYRKELSAWNEAYKAASRQIRQDLKAKAGSKYVIVPFFRVNYSTQLTERSKRGTSADRVPTASEQAISRRWSERGWTSHPYSEIQSLYEAVLSRSRARPVSKLARFQNYLAGASGARHEFLQAIARQRERLKQEPREKHRLVVRLFEYEVKRRVAAHNRYSSLELRWLRASWLASHPRPTFGDSRLKKLHDAKAAIYENLIFHEASWLHNPRILIRSGVVRCLPAELPRRNRTYAPFFGRYICGYDGGSAGSGGSMVSGWTSYGYQDGRDYGEPIVPISWYGRGAEPYGDVSLAQALTAMASRYTDVESYRPSNDGFNIVRSTAELKDLPATLRTVIGLAIAVRSEKGLFQAYSARAPKRALQSVSLSRTLVHLAKGSLRWCIAVDLAWKFGIQPTIRDVNSVLTNGVNWATDCCRSLRQLVAGSDELIRSMTLRARVPYAQNPPRTSPWHPTLTGQWTESFHEFSPPGLDDEWLPNSIGSCPFLDYVFGRSFADIGAAVRQYRSVCKGFATSLEYTRFRGVSWLDKESYFFARLKRDALVKLFHLNEIERAIYLADPLKVAWELVPLSFICDWFTTTRQVVQTMSNELTRTLANLPCTEDGIWVTVNSVYGIQDFWSHVPEHARYVTLKPQVLFGTRWISERQAELWGVPHEPHFGASVSYPMYLSVAFEPSYAMNEAISSFATEWEVTPIARRGLRCPCSLPDNPVEAGVVPAFQLKVSADKLFTLSELILQGLRL